MFAHSSSTYTSMLVSCYMVYFLYTLVMDLYFVSPMVAGNMDMRIAPNRIFVSSLNLSIWLLEISISAEHTKPKHSVLCGWP